jgi:hypothetical protein
LRLGTARHAAPALPASNAGAPGDGPTAAAWEIPLRRIAHHEFAQIMPHPDALGLTL